MGACVSHAPAQVLIDERAVPARGNPAALLGRDSAQGVYVRDSAVAIEKFALAERLEHLKEWDKSADVYMEILQGYTDRVVPSEVDEDNRIYQYTSVAAAVQERLARWPESGLLVYRTRYEPAAEALLEQAGDDLSKLHRVISLYFVTESSKQAALRLMELYFRGGDFAAAAWLGDRMLQWHPALRDERATFLFRTGIAYHLCGDASRAADTLEELQEKHADAVGTIRGTDVKLAESLANELQITRPTLRAGSADSWPIAFGGPDRARVPQASAGFGARLYSVEITSSMIRTPLMARRDIDRLNQEHRSQGAMTGVLPVVDRGEMFFNDNARIYAVNLESGTALAGWAETYDGDRQGRYSLNAWSTPRGQQSTVTVTEDSVYAVMALPDMLAMHLTGTMTPRGESRLVCLDRRSGRERWIASSRTLPQESGIGRNLDFSGSPVVVGDSVYIMGRGGKGMQFEDSYVLAFDAATGRSMWICYLSSANTGFWDFVGDVGSVQNQRVSHLAYWGGRLYAITNLGALAAVDAYDGTIVWLNLYPRDVAEPNRMMGGFNPNWQRARGGRMSSSAPKPWTSNPVVVTDGKVFVLPSDGSHVLIYDAASGMESARIPLAQFEDANTLVGVVDEKLVLASQKTIFCINWPAYDEARGADGNLVWRSLSFLKAQYPEDAIRGRAFLTRESVLVPTAWALHRISLQSGRHEASYPHSGADWGDGEGPGNVLVLQDRLIVAGPERISVYTDLRLAMAKLDAEVAAAPTLPEPRLRYAEIMSVAGKWDVAMQKLDEAMQLLGGPQSASASPARDRLFADALAFAQRVSREGAGGLESASAFFERAAAAAITPAQHVNYRLTHARVMKSTLSPQDELALYQQILADAAMRDVPVSASEGTSTRPAGVVAERAITDLLARAGRAVYEPYEAAAVQQLEAAVSYDDPNPLLAIAREFPNARVAPQALQAAAEEYEAKNDPRLAAQVLRQLLFKYPDYPQRARTIESLARSYLALPNRVDVAIARLQQGARLRGARLSQPLKLPNGQMLENVTFDEAANALRKLNQELASQSLPDMQIGSGVTGPASFLASPDSVLAGISALILPVRDFSRPDRVVGFAPDRGVLVYPPGEVAPLFVNDQIPRAPVNLAWLGNNLLLWDNEELWMLHAETGQTLWSTALSTLPTVEVVPAPAGMTELIDPAADEAAEPRVQQHFDEVEIRLQQNVRLRRRLQVQAMQQQLGQAQPAAAVAGPEQIVQVRPLSDRIVFGTSSGRVVALDSADGSILWQTRPSERGASHLLASDDFIVLRLEDGPRVQLLVLDALVGQFLSRRSFDTDATGGMVPINVALAADGTLVWLLPDRLCGKDLFEPGDRLTFEQFSQRDGNMSTFLGSISPDHLQIADGRIFVFSDNGTYVRAYSLATGKPLRGRDSDLFLTTGVRPGTWQAIMRPFGRKLYVAGSQHLYSYDLENLKLNQNTPLDARTAIRPRDLIVSKGHVVVVSEPSGAAPVRGGRRNAPTILQLLPVSRAPFGEAGGESGMLDATYTITDPATIQTWQPVNGGVYYLTGDQKLHFLRGAKE